MPDITMCYDSNCKLKEHCLRFVSKPSGLQSFSNFYRVGEECEYFIEVDEEKLSKAEALALIYGG